VEILGDELELDESELDELEQPGITTLINNKTMPQHTLKIVFIVFSLSHILDDHPMSIS